MRKIFSNFYFHYGTSYENPICSHHYTFSAYRWEDVFVPSAKMQHDDAAHFGIASQNNNFFDEGLSMDNLLQSNKKEVSSPTRKIELLTL